MKLAPNEQETIITYDRSSKFAYVYTANPTEMRKLDAAPDIYKVHKVEKADKKIIAKTYKCEKKFITLRKKIITRKKVET